MRYRTYAIARFCTALKEIGVEPVIADALDAAAVKATVGRIRPDAVINELTSLPRHYAADMKAAAERDRKVRVEGNISLLAALRDSGVRRYLLQSSGFWYAPGAGLAYKSAPFISSASQGVEASARTFMELEARASATPGIEFVALRYGSSTAPALGTRARAIWVIKCGNSRFRLSVRARASTASCILTMRLGRPLPRWSARRGRTTSSTEPVTSALVADGVRACCRSTCATSRQRRRGASGVRPRRGLLRDEA